MHNYYLHRQLYADGNPVDGGSTPDPAKTRFTLSNGNTEEYDISGTLTSDWFKANGFQNGVGEWQKEFTKIEIGNTVTSIGAGAIGSYFGPNIELHIPSSVTTIGEGALEYTGFSKIVIEKTKADAKTMLTVSQLGAGEYEVPVVECTDGSFKITAAGETLTYEDL